MIHIEQENTNHQLKEALKQKTLFHKIDPTVSASKIISGGLIKTNNGYLLLNIASGKTMVDGIDVIALSPYSPLAKK